MSTRPNWRSAVLGSRQTPSQQSSCRGSGSAVPRPTPPGTAGLHHSSCATGRGKCASMNQRARPRACCQTCHTATPATRARWHMSTCLPVFTAAHRARHSFIAHNCRELWWSGRVLTSGAAHVRVEMQKCARPPARGHPHPPPQELMHPSCRVREEVRRGRGQEIY